MLKRSACAQSSFVKCFERPKLLKGTRKNLALCAAGSMLRSWLYALGSMRLALCACLYARLYWLHALGSMRSALRTRLCALGPMELVYELALHTALWTWLHALGSMCLRLRK